MGQAAPESESEGQLPGPFRWVRAVVTITLAVISAAIAFYTSCTGTVAVFSSLVVEGYPNLLEIGTMVLHGCVIGFAAACGAVWLVVRWIFRIWK